MGPKITDEMREALRQHPGQPVTVEDDRTKKVYYLVEQEAAVGLVDAWVRGQLQVGFDQMDRGEFDSWDIEATIAEARRRHANQAS